MFYASDTAGKIIYFLFFFKLKIVNIFDRGGRIECSLSEEQSDTDKQAPLLKPVLNWANVCSPEHTSDTSTNYDSFLN